MNMKTIRNAMVLACAALWLNAATAKTLIDYFLPMEPQEPLVSEGIWGADTVLPRDIKNGLEDPHMKTWCYWDGRIVKGDDGRYHFFGCHWDQRFSHADGWKRNSKAIHAVSDNVMGPYKDLGMMWPHWKNGEGCNVIGLRMQDGRYAAVTSETTEGEIFVADTPEGPWQFLGKIQVDLNGFEPGLARYQNRAQPSYGHMSNVKILLRPDGRYMIVARSTAVMISDSGILGPYRIVSDRVYKAYPKLPQTRNEDPTVWYSGGMYHMVYNHWPSKTSYHFSSLDGIKDWTYRGIAFKKGVDKVFRYADGTVNDWAVVERMTAYVEDGHVTHFIFSVIDVGKGQDLGGDNHGSKIVVVPFDGVAFDRDMQALIQTEKQAGFPFVLPREKPDRALSAAMERNYTAYSAPRPEDNELYSLFKYTKLKGFDYNGHDGTVSRRDPSKVIFANGKYYVWYTHRHTPVPPQGADKCTDTIPSSDWDLADIWYATSKDGFTWQEQGVAVPRPPKPQVGWRSVTTADILIWKGTYYLYYQGFMQASGTRGDDCPVAVSYADSPDGPWTPYNKIVVPNGAPGEWDQYSIHDPYPLVYHGKIYLYYKSDFDGDPSLVRMQGLAIADHPLGPFKKHPLNPVINSGHETTLFPFKSGIAALVYGDGNEHNTVQFAKDGVNFEIASIVELMPIAGGPFVPDAFTNTQDGRGITWGLSHFTNFTTWAHNHAILMRFDCDLSLDLHDPEMKHHRPLIRPDQYFKQALSKQQKERIQKYNRHLREQK